MLHTQKNQAQQSYKFLYHCFQICQIPSSECLSKLSEILHKPENEISRWFAQKRLSIYRSKRIKKSHYHTTRKQALKRREENSATQQTKDRQYSIPNQSVPEIEQIDFGDCLMEKIEAKTRAMQKVNRMIYQKKYYSNEQFQLFYLRCSRMNEDLTRNLNFVNCQESMMNSIKAMPSSGFSYYSSSLNQMSKLQ